MNIINVAIKEIKQNLREKKSMVMMTLFPIVLIAILGAAFSNAFSKSVKLDEIKVLYNIEGSGYITSAFEAFTQNKEIKGVSFIKTKDKKSSLDKIMNSKYACFINVSEESKSMELYKNAKYNIEAGVVEIILRTYSQKYNTINEIAKNNPIKLTTLNLKESVSFVKNQALSRKKSPRAIDYYGITMLSLFVTYGAFSGVYSILRETYSKTGRRILTSPIKKYELLTGKIIGVILVTLMQISIVFLVSKYGFKVYYGENIYLLAAIIISLVILVTAFGIGVAFITGKENKASAIINTIIPIFAFLGGGYTPVSGSGIFGEILKLSPLKWTNDAMFKLIYDGSNALVFQAITINLVIAFIFILIASIISSKEEALI